MRAFFTCIASEMNCFKVLFEVYGSFEFAITWIAIIFASGGFSFCLRGKLIWSIVRRA